MACEACDVQGWICVCTTTGIRGMLQIPRGFANGVMGQVQLVFDTSHGHPLWSELVLRHASSKQGRLGAMLLMLSMMSTTMSMVDDVVAIDIGGDEVFELERGAREASSWTTASQVVLRKGPGETRVQVFGIG